SLSPPNPGLPGFGTLDWPKSGKPDFGWGEGWGEGVRIYRETLTLHPTPLPMGEGADRVRGIKQHHCPNNPALAAAASQILASSSIMAANSEGVLAMVSRPLSPRTRCTSAELRMRTTSPCKRAVVAAGRSGGPSKPIQVRPGTKPGISSAMVGTSGSFA